MDLCGVGVDLRGGGSPTNSKDRRRGSACTHAAIMAVVVQPPSGTVTFLFTDIESSTRLWEENPNEMRELVAHHDERFRAAIEAHRGYVVKGTGDGFHAAFARAADAVKAAERLQAATADLRSLRVRIGINTGEVQERDGDYFGPAVNRAARLMSAAHGGQILVSSATERLLSGVELRDLGIHRLRDLSTPEHVFQLCRPELEDDFAPLKSLDALPGNLPVQVTSFLGRDAEVKMLLELFGLQRLITLTGVGGVGKTRLALQVAAEALDRFSDGAWFCELAVTDDESAMAQVVASTLGCVQRPGLSMMDSIVEYLKVRDLLLILDNCEHVLDAASSLAEAVLQRCRNVTVLATSREALGVDGERVVRVRSLEAPYASTAGSEVLQSSAVRLFAERAVDAGASAAWTGAQLTAVGEICRRVDGIPLAIELAASRASSMSAADIAAHLDERFRLLTGRRRGRVERHQTLRATVEWSYQLLDETERLLFDRLGVFAGTFDAAAASAVACDEQLDNWQVINAIATLVAKSMLTSEVGPEGTTRYSMLETLRQFARERVDETDCADDWRRKHAEHYSTIARQVGFGLVGPDEVEWLSRLQAELDNVRAAVGWALDHDGSYERELGVRIVAPLAYAGWQRPQIGIARSVAQAADHASTLGPELRAPVLAGAASFWWNQGFPDRARELARTALLDGIVTTSPFPLAAHQALMAIEVSLGNYDAALTVGNDVRPALDALDNPHAASTILSGLAIWEAMAGQVYESRRDAERSLELGRQSRNPYALANAFHAVMWANHREDPVEALNAAERYLEFHHQSAINLGGAAAVLAVAGGMRSRLGNPPGALELFREAVQVSRDQGTHPQMAAALDWALSSLTKIGRSEAAAVFVGALTKGALAGVGDFPGVVSARSGMLERIRSTLGDPSTEAALARGAAMSYDEIVEYALVQLQPADEA